MKKLIKKWLGFASEDHTHEEFEQLSIRMEALENKLSYMEQRLSDIGNIEVEHDEHSPIEIEYIEQLN